MLSCGQTEDRRRAAPVCQTQGRQRLPPTCNEVELCKSSPRWNRRQYTGLLLPLLPHRPQVHRAPSRPTPARPYNGRSRRELRVKDEPLHPYITSRASASRSSGQSCAMDWRAVCLRAASASRAAVRDDSSMDWRANCSHLHSPPAAPVSNEWARLDTEAQVTRTHLPSRLKRDERPKAISQVAHAPRARASRSLSFSVRSRSTSLHAASCVRSVAESS